MFSRAIIAFEDTIIMEGDKDDSLYYLLCLYMNTDQFIKAVNICDRMLQLVDKSDVESICSIYYYKVYAYNALEDDTQAIKCLDFIIKTTADEEFRNDAIGMKSELTVKDKKLILNKRAKNIYDNWRGKHGRIHIKSI